MKLKHLMTGTALAVVSAGGAFAGDHHSEWYMSFGAGANWVGNDTGFGAGVAAGPITVTSTYWTLSTTFNHATGFTPTTFTTTYTVTSPVSLQEDGVGFAILGSVGYKFDMPWRVELEASARFSDIDRKSVV